MSASPHGLRCRTSRRHGSLSAVAGVLVLFAMLAGCSSAASAPGSAPGSDPGSGPSSTATTASGGPDDPPVTTSASASAQPGDPSVTTSGGDAVPEVTSTIAGTAVGGNSGGTQEGGTQSTSETIRYADGSCTGWAGRNGGTWTAGLVAGARITVRDAATGAVLGTGRLGAGTATNVSADEHEQWMCTFPFTATIRGTVPDTLRLDVRGARSMTARRDAKGRFVASVSTDAAARLVKDCDGLPAGPATGIWGQVVGYYWDSALQTLCSNGIAPDVARVCRPPHIGSDYVVAVVSARDPSVVYEDAGGGVRLTDPAQLGDAPRVVVQVATGQPC